MCGGPDLKSRIIWERYRMRPKMFAEGIPSDVRMRLGFRLKGGPYCFMCYSWRRSIDPETLEYRRY